MHPVENTLLWQRIASVLDVSTYARTLDAMKRAYDERTLEISRLISESPTGRYDLYMPDVHWNQRHIRLSNAFSWGRMADFTYNDWSSLASLLRARGM